MGDRHATSGGHKIASGDEPINMDNCVEIACVHQREDYVTAIEFVDGTVLTLSALLLSALKKLYAGGNPTTEPSS